MILFLAISGSTGAPCHCDPPLAPVGAAPGGPEPLLGGHCGHFGDPKGARVALRARGGDFPWAGERSNPWLILDGAKLRNGRGEVGRAWGRPRGVQLP